jgi:hypothetical protein
MTGGSRLVRVELQDKSQARQYLGEEGVLGKGPAQQSVEGEYLQYTLLKLILYAVKNEWPALLNEALESYCEGERYIARWALPFRHFELAYASLNPATSPSREVLGFMVDYAFHISKIASMQPEWLEIGGNALVRGVLRRGAEVRTSPYTSPLTREWNLRWDDPTVAGSTV